jgi:hypothetical protein
VHALKALPSIAHVKVTPVCPVKAKLAEVALVGLVGPDVMVGAAGGVVLTVQVADAGVGSVLPAPSVACTWNVCWPLARPE